MAARRFKQRAFGGSITLTPSTGNAYIVNAGIAPGTSSFSIEFWAKISGESYAEAATHQLAGISTALYATTGCLISQFANQLIFYSNPGSNVGIVLPSSVRDTWTHFVVVYSSVSGISFYINGELAGGPTARSCNITGTTLESGSGGLSGLKSGNMGQFRYWKGVALTTAQVSELFYDDILPSTPYCEARFAELSGTTVANTGSMGVNFTTGATVWNIDTPPGQLRSALQNFLKYSDVLSNAAWVQGNLASVAVSPLSHPTRTGGVVWRLTENNANSSHQISQTLPAALAGRPVRGSFNVRGGGGRDFFAFDAGNYINLTTGVAASVGAGYTIVVRALGNSWYNVVWEAPAYVSVQGFYMSSANGVVSYLGNGSYIDVCDFSIQLQSGVSTNFLETSASPVLAEVGALAPQQNLAVNSEFASAASGWFAYNSALTSAAGVLRMTESVGVAEHGTYQNLSLAYGQTNTIGVEAKAGTRSWLRLRGALAASQSAYFNLATGAIGTVTAGCKAAIEACGDGYFRCSLTSLSVTNPEYMVVTMTTGDNVASYNGDGSSYLDVRRPSWTLTNTWAEYVSTPVGSNVNNAGTPRGQAPRQNLIRYSDDMTVGAAFNLTNLTSITALGNVGPGSLPAFRMTDAAGAGGHYTSQTLVTTPTVGRAYTLSANVRAGTKTAIVLAPEGAGFQVTYDLTAGTATTSIGAPIGTAITALGDGWYRCSLTFVSAGASGYRFYISPTSYVADGTGTMDWCGIQLTEASGVANYIASSTTISEGAPRGQMARQNFLLYSEDYTQAAWTKQAGTVVTPNDTAAPDGTMTASTIDVTAAAANQGIFQVASVVAQAIGQTLTRSVWVKGTLGETVKISDPSMTTGTTTVTFTGAWQRESLSEAAWIGGSGIWLRKGTASTFKMWGAQISSTQGLAPYVRTGAVATTGGIQTPRSQIA